MTDVNDRATAVTSGGRPSADLAIIETRVYRGANVWSYDKAIHLVVDLGVLEEYPTNTLPGFTEHLLEALPGLREHSCSRGRRAASWSGSTRAPGSDTSPSTSRSPSSRSSATTSGAARPARSRARRAATTSSTATSTSRSGSRPGGSPYAS